MVCPNTGAVANIQISPEIVFVFIIFHRLCSESPDIGIYRAILRYKHNSLLMNGLSSWHIADGWPGCFI